MTETGPTQVGLILFDQLTQLDLTGPFEVLARVPNVAVHLVAKSLEPVRSDTGLEILPTMTFGACPSLDVICVPGGPGVNDAMLDEELIEFVRRQAATVRYVTSVCSGALILGAAGLLEGARVATHWASVDYLAAFGAQPAAERVCVDRHLITGGGVTAGIDFGLSLAALLALREAAERIQLFLEYAPEPPFSSGTPQEARPEIVAAYRLAAAPMLERRAESVRLAAQRLALLQAAAATGAGGAATPGPSVESGGATLLRGAER
jgi:cyclohexyl-isocyanide hydratase